MVQVIHVSHSMVFPKQNGTFKVYSFNSAIPSHSTVGQSVAHHCCHSNHLVIVTIATSVTYCSKIKNILKRREECDTYLTHVCRHRWSRKILMKIYELGASANIVAFIGYRYTSIADESHNVD